MKPNHPGVDVPLGRVLVMMPGNLDDAVQATAMLNALRESHPDAHITALVKRRLRPVLWGLDSVDRVLSIRKRKRSTRSSQQQKDRVSLVRLGRRLSRGGFNTAIILPGSFRSAALAAVAGIPRRIGYEQDGRGVLLTDRLVTRRHRRARIPVSSMDRYLGIARYLGAVSAYPVMQQRVLSRIDQQVAARLAEADVNPSFDAYVLEVASRQTKTLSDDSGQLTNVTNHLSQEAGLTIVQSLFTEPRKRHKQRRTNSPSAASDRSVNFGDLTHDLHQLKALIQRSRIVVSNAPAVLTLAESLGVKSIRPTTSEKIDTSVIEDWLKSPNKRARTIVHGVASP